MKRSIIKALAGASQRRCSTDGYGFEFLLYRDGTIHESPSSGDALARGNGDGWEGPILRVSRPMTMKEIESAIQSVGREG